MLLSAIDIGSNAVRLFFSNVFEKDGQMVIEKASLMRVPLRLGEDAFVRNRISDPSTEKLVKTMKAFRLLIDVTEPVAFRACATSAMREVENSEDVIQRVEQESKIKIHVIGGVEEAEIISAVRSPEEKYDFRYSLYIDVGGGSTELSLISKDSIVDSASFKIGTVRMLNEKVEATEWARMEVWLMRFKKIFPELISVGTGGNINKIATLYGRVPDKTLPFTNLEYALNHLQKFTIAERIEHMGLSPDRADVIVSAAEIFYFIMKKTGGKILFVPRFGLCDGIVSVLYKEIKSKEYNALL